MYYNQLGLFSQAPSLLGLSNNSNKSNIQLLHNLIQPTVPNKHQTTLPIKDQFQVERLRVLEKLNTLKAKYLNILEVIAKYNEEGIYNLTPQQIYDRLPDSLKPQQVSNISENLRNLSQHKGSGTSDCVLHRQKIPDSGNAYTYNFVPGLYSQDIIDIKKSKKLPLILLSEGSQNHTNQQTPNLSGTSNLSNVSAEIDALRIERSYTFNFFLAKIEEMNKRIEALERTNFYLQDKLYQMSVKIN